MRKEICRGSWTRHCRSARIRTALAELSDTPSRYVLVSNPTLGHREFYEHLAREFGLQSLLFARGRTGSAAPTDLDRAWHQRIIDICRIHRIRLLGAFVATPGAVVPLPAPLQQAS